MRNVIIVGAGGFAAEVSDYIDSNNSNGDLEKINIVGYLDASDAAYNRYNFNAPFLGSERSYEFSSADKVIVAIGSPEVRKSVIDYLASIEVEIVTFFHHSCVISKYADIGSGNIFCPFVVVGPNVRIGSNNVFNHRTAIPHDCEVGSNNVFSPNVQITGYSKIGDSNFFGVSSGTKPNLIIGSHNKIQAGIMVDKNISNNSIVFSMNKIKAMEIYK